MRKLLSSWWFWILVPGGSAVAGILYLYQRGKARQAGTADAAAGNAAYDADPIAAATSAAAKAAEAAKAYADTLRSSGIAGDPTAQALLGITGGIPQATAPADVAANTAKAKTLKEHLQGLIDAAAAQLGRYRFNHDGGQSQEQESNIQNDYAAQESSDQAALAALGAI